MPANLTPQYHAAEDSFKKASTPEEKIEALQEMLAVIPKHKGTEKLQAELKRRLSKLRDEGEKKSKGSTYNPFYVEKQGAGQVVIVGYPNTGKSSLLSTLTRAKAKVAEYPFTTSIPLAGMLPYRDIYIQLVDTPPISQEGSPPGLLNTLRGGDLLLITIDAASDLCLEQAGETLSFLLDKKIIYDLGGKNPPAEEIELTGRKYLPFILAATKLDLPSGRDNLPILQELYPNLSFLEVSVNDENSLETLKESIFQSLEIIRVYTKAPGKQADMKTPFVLRQGETVVDLAYSIHRDFPNRLRNARIWGSAKFEGQSVARDYVLEDGDIVELNV
ncbi:MAG TPA: TGS domain-containing protein [Firmicutes bacterium]|nr:TGS domain-containing protein [Bacillota bacterium]